MSAPRTAAPATDYDDRRAILNFAEETDAVVGYESAQPYFYAAAAESLDPTPPWLSAQST